MGLTAGGGGSDDGKRKPADVIADAIASTADDIHHGGAYCSGWVMIASWMDAEGEYWLSRLADARQPSWHTIGMLRAAQLAFEHEYANRPDGDGDDD